LRGPRCPAVRTVLVGISRSGEKVMRARTLRTVALAIVVVSLGCSLVGCAARPVVLAQGYEKPWVVFFVAHAAGDDTHMEEEIASELRRRGLTASAGAYESRPPNTDVLVLYRDSWWLNILAQGEILTLELRDARTGTTIASAEQRWISYIGDVPDAMIADVVTQVLGTDPVNGGAAQVAGDQH